MVPLKMIRQKHIIFCDLKREKERLIFKQKTSCMAKHFRYSRTESMAEERSKWNQLFERALTTTPIDSRAFRAGVIWNPLRGLTFNKRSIYDNSTSEGNPNSWLKSFQSYRFCSWFIFTDNFEEEDFKDYLQCMKTDEKKIYLVDSGLSFNLPFPLTLRPKRGIELYITFDFSSRKSDSTPPFRVSFTDSSKLEVLNTEMMILMEIFSLDFWGFLKVVDVPDIDFPGTFSETQIFTDLFLWHFIITRF